MSFEYKYSTFVFVLCVCVYRKVAIGGKAVSRWSKKKKKKVSVVLVG